MSTPALETVVRRGAYYDSITLLNLQRALADCEGVEAAAAVMGTPMNLQLLADNGLLSEASVDAGPDDLVVAVRAIDTDAARATICRLDELLNKLRSTSAGDSFSYRPRTLRAALRYQADANLAVISVPSRYAAELAEQCLDSGLCVFLFSDNVALEDEIALKTKAAAAGLLLLGPDCGTSILGGAGIGFANAVPRGNIGIVAASGTGLQEISVLVGRYGCGVSQAIGTGGRDLIDQVGGITFRQAIDALATDANTDVIVLAAKPGGPNATAAALQAARASGKPVVAHFQGLLNVHRADDHIIFTNTLQETAAAACRLAGSRSAPDHIVAGDIPPTRFSPEQKYLRGLYGGGTLALETVHLLQKLLDQPCSSAAQGLTRRIGDLTSVSGDVILDLGDDAFTVGQLHPMLDPASRARWLMQAARDPGVAVVLLDVVLGHGAHADPAAELAPAITAARSAARDRGRDLAVVIALCGSEHDPQYAALQAEQLALTGALIRWSNAEAALCALALLKKAGRSLRADRLRLPLATSPAAPAISSILPALPATTADRIPATTPLAPAARRLLSGDVVAINAGLDVFATSLSAQGVPALPLNWRPPAQGDARLQQLLQLLR